MDDKDFEKLLDSVGDLSIEQFRELTRHYATKNKVPEKAIWGNTVYTESEKRLIKAGVNSCCPECGSISIDADKENRSGIQSYICKDCNFRFTRFTGTLLERTRYPWDVWVEVLRMVLNDDSIGKMKVRLEKDFGCEGITNETLFHMRMKLIYSMAAVPPPKLSGVIQADESVLRESQKGSKRTLVSYIKGEERKARYGRQPSKYGPLSNDFATLLVLADDKGYCICRFVCLGRATVEHVADLFEEYCYIPAYICTDGNPIYSAYCNAVAIPHYIKSSKYNTDLNKALIDASSGKTPKEIREHNARVKENLYKNKKLDYIEFREDLSYYEFQKIKNTYNLNLARVNELHDKIKQSLERKMTNISTKYLPAYIGFFTYKRNWRVKNGHTPISTADAEIILEELLPLKVAPSKEDIKATTLDVPKTTGRFMQILKYNTELVRERTANKYFKFDSEDIPSFNKREILLDAPRYRLDEIARAHNLKGYTKLNKWTLVSNILKLPDAEEIVIDLISAHKAYEISEEDIKYIQSMKYRTKKD